VTVSGDVEWPKVADAVIEARKFIASDRIAPAFSHYRPFDLPCIPIALSSIEIQKPFPVSVTRKGLSEAQYHYH